MKKCNRLINHLAFPINYLIISINDLRTSGSEDQPLFGPSWRKYLHCAVYLQFHCHNLNLKTDSIVQNNLFKVVRQCNKFNFVSLNTQTMV